MSLLLATALLVLAPQEAAAAPKAKELAAQTVCPIGGKPIDRAHFADYEGQRVYFCGQDCSAKFLEFPDKHLYAMFAKGERPENVQSACPVSGEKLERADCYFEVWNKRIYTCCEKCLAKVKADPAPYLDVLEGRKAQATCPVSDMPVDGKSTVTVQGQTVALCCPKCAETVQKAPDQYFAQLAKSKQVAKPAAMHCAVMDEPVETKEFFVTYQGRRIYFCCLKCIPAFAKSPQKYLAN